MEYLKNLDHIERLHEYMEGLLDPKLMISKSELYHRYKDEIEQVHPMDLFYLPYYQEDTELTIDDIKDSAGKFVNVFYHGLSAHQPESYDSLLFTYFIKEHRAIESYLDEIKPLFKQDKLPSSKDVIKQHLKRCVDIDKVYIKMEHILFPMIEDKLPSKQPLDVLWSLHDDARQTLKELLQLLDQEEIDMTSLIFLIGEYYNLVYGIHTKEELILFPVAVSLLSISEQDQLFQDCLEYGFAFIEDIPEINQKRQDTTMNGELFQSLTGTLDANQLELLFGAIPIDITLVDKNDKVRFFNNRKERHFPRTPSIIGRHVHHCHPKKSVHVVEEILQAFKDGSRDQAEFWIDFRGTFLYITYYALRDDVGAYQGTLEVSQDVTRIRTLDGQKRLLEWT